MVRILFFVVILSLAAACNPVQPGTYPGPYPGAGLDGAWSVKMIQSGGIAGVQQVVTVDQDGRVVAMDERANLTGTVQLTSEQLGRLEEQIRAALTQRSGRQNSNCADCFIYDLEIRTPDDIFSAQVDDVTLPDSGLEALVMNLRDLMEQALSTP